MYLNENISGLQSSEVLYSINSFFSFLSRKIWIILYCFAPWKSLVWLLRWCHLCHYRYICVVFFIYNFLIQIFMMKLLGFQSCKTTLYPCIGKTHIHMLNLTAESSTGSEVVWLHMQYCDFLRLSSPASCNGTTQCIELGLGILCRFKAEVFCGWNDQTLVQMQLILRKEKRKQIVSAVIMSHKWKI